MARKMSRLEFFEAMISSEGFSSIEDVETAGGGPFTAAELDSLPDEKLRDYQSAMQMLAALSTFPMYDNLKEAQAGGTLKDVEKDLPQFGQTVQQALLALGWVLLRMWIYNETEDDDEETESNQHPN